MISSAGRGRCASGAVLGQRRRVLNAVARERRRTSASDRTGNTSTRRLKSRCCPGPGRPALPLPPARAAARRFEAGRCCVRGCDLKGGSSRLSSELAAVLPMATCQNPRMKATVLPHARGAACARLATLRLIRAARERRDDRLDLGAKEWGVGIHPSKMPSGCGQCTLGPAWPMYSKHSTAP